ncbi:IAA-alanine resistance protein 1 [Senna tora]|uniref:IAA-alanine resistance protein 1 n=1 Tax=Senna tora TaxID=362788 RepID=A0A834ST50_9FABA|nr:IAA-alanine resistance protein 1 [Senna tora]
MALCRKLIEWAFLAVLVLGFCLDPGIGHEGHHSGSCTSEVHESIDHHHHHHQCEHGHQHHHHHHHNHQEEKLATGSKLPEELAEEEDMKLYGFGFAHDHGHGHHGHFGGTELSGLVHKLNCQSYSLAVQGKPSKAVVDSLALFGAGAMLGDAFLHQLPHAFGGEHSHSHGNHADHDHDHEHDAGFGHGHSHSLADLSTGISILEFYMHLRFSLINKYLSLAAVVSYYLIYHSPHWHNARNNLPQ